MPEAHSHQMREPRVDRCSCCLETIYPQTQNMVQVIKIPESIVNDNGEVVGKLGIEGPQAYFHAPCFMIHLGQDVTMECESCGVFKMAQNAQAIGNKWEKKLVPITDICDCQCHSGHQYECSKVRIYKGSDLASGDPRQLAKFKRKMLKKQKEQGK